MDTGGISTALAVGTDDTVTLATGVLPGIDAMLTAYNEAQPLVVHGAALQVVDSTVTLTGTARFLGIGELAVRGDFASAAGGGVTITLRFDLLSNPARPAWTFGDSFPALPDLGDGLTLGAVAVAHAAAVLTNVAGIDPVTHQPLVPGLNVVGDLDATSLLGVLATSVVASTLGDVTRVPMHAVVTASLPDVPVPPDPIWPRRPWDVAGPVPGITVFADVPLSLALGGLTFDRTQLRVYVPPTQAWLDDNPAFLPVVAFTGHLTVPSASADLPVTATWQPGSNVLDVDGQFADIVNVANLAALADLVHHGDGTAPDLTSLLPADVSSRLGKISLQCAGVGLSLAGGTQAVQYAYFSVGLDGLDWDVFAGISADAVWADFTVNAPFSADRSIVTGVGLDLTLGGAPLSTYVTDDGGLFVRVQLDDGAELPLGALFHRVVPELPAPPDLSLDSLSAQRAADGSYAFSATVAESTPWTLDIGPTTLTISDVSVDATKDAAGTSAALLAGTLEVAGVEVEAAYASPGDFSVRAQLPDLALSDLATAFGGVLPAPSGWDVHLPSSSVLIEGTPGALTFTVASQVDGVGLVAFAAQPGGVAAGIDLGGGSASSLLNLPALSVLEGSVERLMVVLSTMAQPAFQFPDRAAFRAPTLPSNGPKLPAHANGLVQGLNVYGLLRSSGNRGLGAILRFLHVPFDGTVGVTIAVALPDPGKGSRLGIAVDGTVSGVAITGQAGLLLTNDEPGAYLEATATATIQGQPATGTVEAVVLPDGILVQGSLAGSVTFGPVTLSDLALVVGMDWEGIPSIGVAATIDVSELEASVAVFFDSVDPSSSMFAGSFTGASLGTVVRALAGADLPAGLAQVVDGVSLGSLSAFRLPESATLALNCADLPGVSAAFVAAGAPALPSASNQVLLHPYAEGFGWHLATIGADGVTRYSLVPDGDGIDVRLDPQVYLVPREVTLVGLPPYEPAFRVAAKVDLWGLTTSIDVDVVASRGITADLAVSGLDIGGVFAVTAADGTGGPRLSLATFADESRQDPSTREPHFFLSGRVAVLGATVASCLVNVTAQGFVLDVTDSPAPGVHLTIHASAASGAASIGAEGTVGVAGGIDLGPLGTVHLDTDADVKVDAHYGPGGLGGDLGVAISLLGQTWPMHTIPVAITPDLFTSLGHVIASYAESLAGEVFADAARWAIAVANGLVTGIDASAAAVAAGLKTVFGATSAAAAAALKAAGYAATEVASAMLGVGYAADEVGSALSSAYGMTSDQVGIALRDAGASMEVVGGVLRDSFNYTAVQTGAFFQSAYGATSAAVSSALSSVGYAANEVGSAIGGLFSKKSPLNPSNW